LNNEKNIINKMEKREKKNNLLKKRAKTKLGMVGWESFPPNYNRMPTQQ